MSLFRDLLIDKKRRRYYTEVEYLESTGTQYIDTGYIASNTSGFKVDIMPLQTSDRYFIGSRPRTIGNDRWLAGSISGPQVYIGWNTNTFVNWELNKVHTVQNNFLNSRTKVLDGTVVAQITETLASQGTRTAYLFSANDSNVTSMDICRIYGAKISDGNTLVRDFIPVLDWDMTPAMYDKVSGQLFYNQGTGSFTYGRQIHPVEYLESTGTQYINTGYKPNTNTECSMAFMFTSLDSTYRTPLSIRTSDGAADSFTMATTTTSLLNFAFGTTYFDVTTSPQANTYYKATLKSGEATLNNLSVTKAASTITQSGLTAYMFARNANGTASNFFKGKIYNCQIKESNTLVRDYIPCVDESGTGYMFDRVTHTLFGNSGTGQFAYPPVELEYIENTGTQYINTGYNPNSNTKVEARFKMNETTDTFKWLFLSRNENLAGDGYGFGSVANGYIDSEFNNRKTSTTDKLTNGVIYDVVKDKNVCQYNDKTLTNPNSTFTVNYPLTIFVLNNGAAGIAQSTYTKANCYYFKIYDNGTLVRDLVPAFKDGSAGMWDKANNVFYSNAGTGSFVAGSVIEPKFE